MYTVIDSFNTSLILLVKQYTQFKSQKTIWMEQLQSKPSPFLQGYHRHPQQSYHSFSPQGYPTHRILYAHRSLRPRRPEHLQLIERSLLLPRYALQSYHCPPAKLSVPPYKFTTVPCPPAKLRQSLPTRLPLPPPAKLPLPPLSLPTSLLTAFCMHIGLCARAALSISSG